MTELLVGTRKGLFALQGDGEGPAEVTARAFAGEPVEYAMRDPRSGRYLAATTSPFYGPKIWFTDDPAGDWQQADGPALPEGDEALARIWVIVAGEQDGLLYAGGDPGVLFESRDGGTSWVLNEGLWSHPTRPDWQPGNGGLCLHTIVPWPGDPSRVLVAVSSVGVWLTDDGGASWRHSNDGITVRYAPDDAADNPIQHCVHDVRRSSSDPQRLFMQFHDGVYRSDDGGEQWIDIASGTDLPSDFGFPVVVDPDDADTAFVIPLVGAMDRTTPRGAVEVWGTSDAGASWSSRSKGLPATDAYLTVLREAFDSTGGGKALELYFGATSGDVFGSVDGGASWRTVADHLPPVYSVRVA
jgi:hypothetical protein